MKKTLMILFLLVVAFTCKAQNYWISKSGNDSNAGTKAAPFLTISKASTLLFDTLWVVDGSYSEYIDKLTFGIGGKEIIISAPPQQITVTFKDKSFILRDDADVFWVELGNYQMSSSPQIYDPTMKYYNTTVTTYINKSDCPAGLTGSREYYTVVAKLYSSLISQTDAQNKAKADAARNRQGWANMKGVCKFQQGKSLG
jgi:hypothetical protein